jgi:hypothetical protein
MSFSYSRMERVIKKAFMNFIGKASISFFRALEKL